LTLGMVAVAGGQSSESTSGSAEQQAVASLDEQGRQSALKGDTAFLEQHLASTYVGINPMGQALTKEEDIANWKSGDLKLTAIDERDRKIQMYGDAAVVTAIGEIKGTNKGQDISGTYRATRVYVKQHGQWQQVLFQATRVQSGPQQNTTQQSPPQ
jgi:hypothetical protein